MAAVAALLIGLAAYGLTGPGAHQVTRVAVGDDLTYSGSLAAGRFTGTGTLEFANGDVYEGEFADGRFTGHGVLTTVDGQRFVGSFRGGEIVTGQIITVNAPRSPDGR